MRSVFMAYTGGLETSGLRLSGGGDGLPGLHLDFEFGVDKPEFARLQTHVPLRAGENESVCSVRGAGMNGEDLNARRLDRAGGASHVFRSPVVVHAFLGGRAARGTRNPYIRRGYPQTPPFRRCVRVSAGTWSRGRGFSVRSSFCLVTVDQLAAAASDFVGAESPPRPILPARTTWHSLMARAGTISNACAGCAAVAASDFSATRRRNGRSGEKTKPESHDRIAGIPSHCVGA